MQCKNIEEEIKMLDAWCKKSISKKAFIFVTSKKAKKRNFCIARKHYGHIVILSEWLSLSDLEMYLWGILQVRWLKARCNSLPYGRNYSSGYDDMGISFGDIVGGIVQESL